jgi:putative DNA primase/helicase
VIAALRSRGLWTDRRSGFTTLRTAAPTIERPLDQTDATRTEAALTIWRASLPTKGTPVETYLNSRGLRLPPSPVLRFHTGLRHPSGGRWPAMVALVTRGRDGTPVAIHRTFLAVDGAGKASVDKPKMMLGPCRGGAVCVSEPTDVLMVGEGIETCLAAMQATGNPAWAALSTSGQRSLDLPTDVRNVIVLADGDDGGEAAARDCALRWKREGRHVRIARPPQGMDFNDMLTGCAPCVEEAA